MTTFDREMQDALDYALEKLRETHPREVQAAEDLVAQFTPEQ